MDPVSTLIAIIVASATTPASGQPEPAAISWAGTEARIKSFFDSVDRDGDARLSREELFRFRGLHRPSLEEGGMPGLDPRAWGHFDRDRDGYVSRAEVSSGVKAMFHGADADRDGSVTYRERQEAQERAFLGTCMDGPAACLADRSEMRRAANDGERNAGFEPFSLSTRSSFRLNSGISEPRYEAVRDKGSWETLWNRITAGRGPAPLFPRVDFQRDMLLVAAMGQRGRGGYSIQIRSVFPQGPDLVVTVVRTAPGRRCGTTQAVSQPADIVKVAATSRPVRWRFEDRVTQCP